MKNLLKVAVLVGFGLFGTVSMATDVKDMPLSGLAGTKDTSLAQLKGQWVYVDFWASWCGPCKKSFPFMVELQEKYKAEKFKIVAISVDEEKSDALAFLNDNKANFFLYHDPAGKFAEKFKLPGMPTSYLINPEGEIVSKHVGFRDNTAADINKEISAIFNK